MKRWLASWWRPLWSFGWAFGAVFGWAFATHNQMAALACLALYAVGLPLWAADRVERWLQRPDKDHPDSATETTLYRG